MDKFKKWRKQRKPITYVAEATISNSEMSSLPRYQTEPPPLPPPTPAFKFGLKVLHECTDAIVDICFVHGLTGDRDKTWTAVGQTTPWPKILLPPKLNARVLMYGYDANVARKSVTSSNRLINHAQNLLGDLTADRSFCDASSRPLIFVAHSLGGLVCKKAILLSQNAAEPQSRALFDSFEGIAFMGTPHRGAWMADWAKIPASVFGLVKSTNVMLLDILQRDNQLLDSIQVDFLTMVRRMRENGRGIGIACFFEELPFPVIGKIVTEESATLDGYDIYSIYANHRDMVRFASEEDPGFKRLLWKLLTWTSQVGGNTIEKHAYSAEDRTCLRDLQTTNPRDDKSRIEATKGGLLKDSYSWAMEDKRFQDWHYREKGGGILWVRGDPGKGKTMLLCGIIDELSSIDRRPISFFFCQATDARLNYATAVLRGLIYMLIDQEPSLISHVRQRYDESGKQLFENPNAWHALSAIFVEILGCIESPCMIIDAMDECTTGLSLLLDLVVQMSSAHPHVKWIVSSRNWPQIKEHMSLIPEEKKVALEMDENSVSEAVKIFIYDRVQRLAKLKRYTQQMFDAVYDYLLLNAQGTFLWVALVCEKLASIPRLRTIEKLAAFPPGLDALYQRMMQQVCEHEEAPLCKDILGLVSTTYRPITIDELTAFIDLPEYILEDYNESLEEIVEYCGSFLTISKNTIFFVHQSAKDYLLEKAKLEILPTGIAGKHIFIFEKSLVIMEKKLRRDMLSFGKIDGSINPVYEENMALGPLAEIRYSCIYWINHLQECDQKAAARDYLQNGGLLDHFLLRKFIFWLEALSLLKSVSKGLENMSKLETLTEPTPVFDQVLDASRFFRYHKHMIEHHPLGIYSSVLLFTPTCSRIKNWFREEEPGWVTIEPAIEDWSPCLQTISTHGSHVQHLEWAPDGTRLTSMGIDGVIKLWDLASSSCVSSIQAHELVGTSMTWSHDGTYIASASSDRKIKIWDPEKEQCLWTLMGHEGPVKAVFWSQDSTHLVSVSWSWDDENSSPLTIKIWNRITGQCVQTLEGDYSQIRSAFPSYDGKSIVTATCDGIFKTWNVFTSQRMSNRDPFPQFGSLNIWSHDGMNLIHSDWLSNTIEILDPVSWKSIETIDTQKSIHITYVALSHYGKLLASASSEGLIDIWDLTTRKRVSTLEGHSESIHTVLWLRDGRLASASSDTTIKIWDPTTCQCLSTLIGHNRGASSLLLSADETRLISASARGSAIRIWDLGSSTAVDDHTQPVNRVVWSDDAKYVASYSNKEIKVWNPSTAGCLSTMKSPSGTLHQIGWSQNGKLASLSSDGMLRVWDLSSGRCSMNIESFEASASLAWSQDGSSLILASYDGFVKTWDAKTGHHLGTVKVEKPGSLVTWSHDATRFSSIANDWSILIQDSYTGKCVINLKGHHDPEVNEIPFFLRRPVIMCWSRDGTQLASAMGPTIKTWDLKTGQCTLVLEMEQDPRDFHFHFPRGPLFGEPDPAYLHTTIGSFNIEPCTNSPTDASPSLVCSPRPVGLGLSQYQTWITHDGVNLLALPFDYGPNCSVAMAVSGSIVVLGCVTGRVLILKFSKDLSLVK